MSTIEVVALPNRILVGDGVQLIAVARDGDGGVISDQSFLWSSEAERVVAVDSTGLAIGLAAGVAAVEAQAGGVTGTVEIEVVLPPVASVSISGVPDSLEVGEVKQLGVSATDVRGDTIKDFQVRWESLDRSVVSVGDDGQIQGVSRGAGSIRAEVGDVAAEAAIQIFDIPTRIGGILAEDLTLDSAGSPYELDSSVEVPLGVALQIQPGVTIRAGKSSAILVWGTLNAIGLPENPVRFQGLELRPQDSFDAMGGASIVLEHVHLEGGSYGRTFVHSSGEIRIADSHLTDLEVVQARNPVPGSEFVRNIFNRTRLLIRAGVEGTEIRNNAFLDWHKAPRSVPDGFAVRSEGAEVLARHNSFLSGGEVAVALGSHGRLDGRENYWRTTVGDSIQALILDRNVTLSIDHFVPWEPFLDAPHPETPVP